MKAFLNWSGGKDSAFCLYQARKQNINIDALVTTINQKHDRISMHGVRRSLLELQAASIQLPLHTIEMPEQASMSIYEELISKSNRQLKQEGFTHAVSGDLFLEDLKAYREQLYAKDHLKCLFPIWTINTKALMNEFISLGFKAIIVCVNTAYLDRSVCGTLMDESFVHDLPDNVDVCGENGEYHSFVFDGPIFSKPVCFSKGEVVYQEYPAPSKDDCFKAPQPASGFYFQDLIPCE
jgi:uncharacterized protein (TIGR00290 family)